MSTETVRNEAAERLRDDLGGDSGILARVRTSMLDEALAAERRAVEDDCARKGYLTAADREQMKRVERSATVDHMVAVLDALIAHPRNEPRYRAAFAGLKVARRAILDEEAAR